MVSGVGAEIRRVARAAARALTCLSVCAAACSSSPYAPPAPSPATPSPATLPAPPAPQRVGERIVDRAESWLRGPEGARAAVANAWRDTGWAERSAGPGAQGFVSAPESPGRIALLTERRADLSATSDASLLLEIAPDLAAAVRPFSLEVWSFEGEVGARSIAEAWSVDPARTRLAVFLRGGASRDLAVARDLDSHPVFRDRFFREAQNRGASDLFPAGAAFERPPGGHTVLRAAGVRNALLLAPSGSGSPGDPDHGIDCCDAETAERMAAILHAGVEAIAAQLARIDAYTLGRAGGAQPLGVEGLANRGRPEAVEPPEATDTADTGSTP